MRQVKPWIVWFQLHHLLILWYIHSEIRILGSIVIGRIGKDIKVVIKWMCLSILIHWLFLSLFVIYDMVHHKVIIRSAQVDSGSFPLFYRLVHLLVITLLLFAIITHVNSFIRSCLLVRVFFPLTLQIAEAQQFAQPQDSLRAQISQQANGGEEQYHQYARHTHLAL